MVWQFKTWIHRQNFIKSQMFPQCLKFISSAPVSISRQNFSYTMAASYIWHFIAIKVFIFLRMQRQPAINFRRYIGNTFFYLIILFLIPSQLFVLFVYFCGKRFFFFYFEYFVKGNERLSRCCKNDKMLCLCVRFENSNIQRFKFKKINCRVSNYRRVNEFDRIFWPTKKYQMEHWIRTAKTFSSFSGFSSVKKLKFKYLQSFDHNFYNLYSNFYT